MRIEIIIKNNHSSDFNNMAIKKAIVESKVDMDKIKKIYITDKVVNFVTK